ncbi:type 4a pilus biogenesis protein PilO [Candidatus Methylobacter oryzae]|uniref:Pilus assembly protein PilO n=1 Tax=Candidatus Methylobacter oryzae TaxID=2497749 RepID=A0ABY3CCJ1_9GAMM|nr:type 4a pilus biogenesis protein PilO [Candidatus Methylobacter oryzae]TRW99104.1 pilus assembly protein PilO [Candidatus Methylobacter oryzae]
MNLSEINWDPNEAGTWPLPIKAAAISVICIVIFGVGIYIDTLDQLAALEASEKKEMELKQSFEAKQKKSINLPDYQEQLAQIETELEDMIRQMPTEEEVASLLIDISQTGLASGLEFRLFKPGAPVRKDFYSELPISIEVIGKYEELGLFVSGLASLPRIVTVHDVNIVPEGKESKETKGGVMKMNATVKTYNESADGAVPAAKKKRGQK